ncbi:E3 SUMO-protein ligase ZBED1-like [Haliotis rubra]|uniref:E3 SUMO-protein ligase ZBED1-like n=1 Tax=Haliotis rubra TaxID=36100 RepID=UPI001EE5DB2F|nr:E3 SUMO-protein ligase ZBED1-like [Haliotis rubra]
MWTSCATHGYITVTGHYITDEWDLKSCILATRRVEDRHTGENIADALVSIQTEFEIEYVCGLTTDNANNMTVAARATGFPHVRCFAHTLQLAVHDALKLNAIDNVIIHAQKLVSYFSKSVLATQELEDVQKRLGKTVKHVVTDVPTRWNSVYFMFERLNVLHASIVAVLHDDKFKKQKHLNLKDNQWRLLEQLIVALKPLVSATEVLCSEEFPTAAGVYPLVFALVTKHLIPSDLDTRIVADMKTTLADGLKSRLVTADFWLSPTMTATALDPCFKNLRFLNEEQRRGTREHVVTLLRETSGEGQEPPPSTPPAIEQVTVKQEPVSPMKKNKYCETEKAMNFLSGDIIEIADDQNADLSSRNAQQEYEDFLTSAAKVSNLQAGKPFSLSWWKENKHCFPRVATLAQRFLSIPGTSVPSERAFSAAGLTTTQQRA